MFIIIGGIISAVLGILGVIAWWGDFVLMLRGLAPIVLALGGLIAIWAGIDEIKTNREWEQEEAAAREAEQRAAAEAENLQQPRRLHPRLPSHRGMVVDLGANQRRGLERRRPLAHGNDFERQISHYFCSHLLDFEGTASYTDAEGLESFRLTSLKLWETRLKRSFLPRQAQEPRMGKVSRTTESRPEHVVSCKWIIISQASPIAEPWR